MFFNRKICCSKNLGAKNLLFFSQHSRPVSLETITCEAFVLKNRRCAKL